MAKQLNVNLAFSADTSQAKAQIQNLQSSLSSLMKTAATNSSLGLNTGINKAIGNVAQLKAQLESATNIKTGKLDLGKFNESLKKSGMKISTYAKSLQDLGPEGDKAFSQLAQAITTAEVPLRKANGLLAEFGTTLKNTARWQISSSVLHGLEGAMSSAWGYAKDLNESLNDIRIVTGQGSDQMAKFAEQANKAAKALGTTTTRYTDAALIYYQQGLSDEEVIERTDVTTKMANVTGENATDVSSYMTAVWNNFNKAGDESAEHYADIMTKLGAETAASTDEIAAGLSKFSAVADTIGLSFDMASSAVTAIIDQTRESPEVVGTALKTIFSRIEGLKQGETLEDGTDLNKYSQGLATAGISIKDSNNELKDADTILTEIGNTWKDLNKEQQVALAQTVAGTRQYNQFVALFDNWDKVQENLSMASIADGTLQEQADIYAESWEAASNRVRAAWEGIYDSLLDDNFIIDLTDGFANFLSIIEKLIDGMGGFKGVLLVVGSILMKTFSGSMAEGLENMAYNIKNMTQTGRDSIKKLRKDANNNLRTMYADSENTSTGAIKADLFSKQASVQDALIDKQEELLSKGKALTEEEEKQAQILFDIVKAKNESVLKTIEEKDELEKTNQSLGNKIVKQAKRDSNSKLDSNQLTGYLEDYGKKASDLALMGGLRASIGDILGDSQGQASAEQIEKIKLLLTDTQTEGEKAQEIIKKLTDSDWSNIQDEVSDLNAEIEELDKSAEKAYQETLRFASEEIRPDSEEFEDLKEQIDEYGESCTTAGEKGAEVRKGILSSGETADRVKGKIDEFNGKIYTAADGFEVLASGAINLFMAIQGLQGLGDIWNDEDTTTGEKLFQTMMNLSMVIPILIELFDEENRKKIAAIGTDLKSLTITAAKITGYTGEAAAAGVAAEATFTLGGAVKFLLSSFGPLLLILGLVGIAFAVFYQRTHQARKELEEQKNILKDLENQYNNVANSISEVNSKLSDLQNKADTLKNLKYGTAEWHQQLIEVNNAASELIEKYGLIEGQDWYVDSTGAIRIKEEANQKIQDQNAKALRAAQAAKNSQEYVVSESEKNALIEEIKYENSYEGATGETKILRPGSDKEERIQVKKNLNEDDIQSVLTILNDALKTETEFNLSDKESLEALGINEEVANIITSNENLQSSIQKLITSTDAAAEAYSQKFIADFASNPEIKNKLDEAKVDEGLYGGVYSKMAKDSSSSAIEKEKYYLDGHLDEISNEDIEEYRSLVGIEKNENGKYYRSDDTEHENPLSEEDLEKETAKWKSVEEAIEDVNKQTDIYIKAAKDSEDNWKAAEKIQKPLKTYLDLLKKGTKLTKEEEKVRTQSIKEIKSQLGELLDLDEETADLLNPTFVEDNAELIKKAIDGDADALQELQMIAANEIITKLTVDGSNSEAEALKALAEIEKILPDLKVGASIEESGIQDQLIRILKATGMTAKQMENLLSLTGFEGAQVEFKKVTIKGKTHEGKARYGYADEDGTIHYVETKNIVKKPDGEFYYPVIKGGNYNPTVDNINLGDGNNGGNSGDSDSGGGGGSKTKVEKIDRTKKTDIIDRYKEINDALEDQAKLLDKLNDKTDRLYGKKRIDNLKKINNELKDENELLDRKQKEARKYLRQDRKAMQNALDKARKEAGLKESDFKFDKDGDIKNYTSQMTALYNELNKREKEFNKKYAGKVESKASKRAKKNIEDLQEAIDYLKDKISQYDETKLTEEEAKQQEAENKIKMKENNYEMLSHEIEVRVTINENDKRQLDYYFNKLSDDVYKAAEALGVLYDPKKNDQIDNAQKALQNNSKAVDDLNKAYKKGRITQADYVEGLQNQYDSILDNLEALQDLDKQMQEYYGETLDMAAEELAKYTDHMDSLNGVLEHYKSVLELTGRGQDYKAIDTILKGQSKTLKNNYEVSKKNYEMLLAQKKTVEARIASMKESDAAYIIEKKKLDDLIAATDEAYDEMLGDAEDYLSNLQALWENAMEQIKKTTGEALTGGVGFDTLVDSMNNLKNYQDEYLTDTNKLFETNKLLSLVQKDIDKTNNVAAKSRLNNFAKEIEQLQKKDQLSNLELEIAQAKYKQLQAQIALEEAQNAKSIVRLSRDNEGNYGYVYTADQDAISDAEDQLSQAENDLYNIRLNATNEYGEKMVQAWQDYMNKCDEVTRNHVGTEEELNEKLRALQEEYYRNINAYSDLYAIAQEEDTRVVADAWINQFDAIKENGDSWKTTLNDYTDQIMNKFREWQATSEEITTAIGANMDTLATSVNDVTNESDAMAKTVVNKVIPALEDELTEVDELTAAYGRQRQEILDLIAEYERLARVINAQLDAESGLAENSEWNKRISGGEAYNKAKYKDVDKYGGLHYSNVSEENLNKIIDKHNNLSQKAHEVNEKRSKIVNERKAKGEKVYSNTDKYGILHYASTKEKLRDLIKAANAKDAPEFDTGGYTGKWGPEGKLAVLHEKELILNKEDSANILKVVEIVRAMIDSNAAQVGLGTLRASSVADNRQTLEQSVTITAEFPNATDHNEIELAFDSLINRATQYANRK